MCVCILAVTHCAFSLPLFLLLEVFDSLLDFEPVMKYDLKGQGGVWQNLQKNGRNEQKQELEAQGEWGLRGNASVSKRDGWSQLTDI